jgi:hypothetical protein
MVKRRITMLCLVFGLACAPAFATPFGGESACVGGPTQFTCTFPPLYPPGTLYAEILYASMICSNSSGSAYTLQSFQVLTQPPVAIQQIAYQIPITQSQSVSGSVTAGSPTAIFAVPPNRIYALINLTPQSTGTTSCGVSISGEFTGSGGN